MKFKVLLIDDEQQYAGVIRDALVKLGLEVIVAFNVTEALEHLHHVTPNLILLDVMMPGVDGLSLLRWLRTHSERKDIPIHVVSAKVSESDRKKAIEAGANGFLAKPFSIRDLRDLVSEYLPSPAS